MTSDIRAKLRKATLGAKTSFRKEIVEFNGNKFEIRQPSIKSRAELNERCNIGSNADSPDIFNFLVWAVIKNTYVPDTDINVFDEADYDALVENPTGGFMDTFGEIASNLMNVKKEDKKKN